MNIANVESGDRAFYVAWTDSSVTEFPFIWLRDNDLNELHPHTRERVFDLTSVELDVSPDSFEFGAQELVVRWPGRLQPAIYPASWLCAHQPGRVRADPARVEESLWHGGTLASVPSVDASECATSREALLAALELLKRTGLVIFAGLADSTTAGEAFADRIGFKRETNFGVMFEVISKARPNNLAYTSMHLPLHTDLPNQKLIPGYQFLHCFKNDATGGESVFADGFQICADLRNERPEQFELLCSVALPWRFHDDTCDLRQRRPIIGRGANGSLEYFAFNAHIVDVPDMAATTLYEFYAAYRELMIRVRDPRYAVAHGLKPGEMIVFDNLRVLHGRTAFDATSGDRHLRGYYIEQDEVDSRIRVLSRERATDARAEVHNAIAD